MALDVYFRTDIHRALAAGVVLAIESGGGEAFTEYHAGVVAMARHQAATFGVSWPAVVGDVRAALGNDACYLLAMDAGEIKSDLECF